ncbi:MAG: ArsR/SmtB family transcription factor [Sciscionella sp.]
MSELTEPAPEEITLPDVMHALSDPTRLTVLKQIYISGERLCGSFQVGVAKSTLSQHLRVLRKSGLTHTRPDGTQRWISLRRDDIERRFPGLLDVVLAAHGSSVEDSVGAG